MLSKPQTRAISVALLDHGETVPGRGVTNSVGFAARGGAHRPGAQNAHQTLVLGTG